MNTKNIDILNLSRFILLYCEKNEININHFKLQKLLYYIQAWYLVYFDGDSIYNEEPEAWVNGPVYRSVYDLLKDHSANESITVKPDFKNDIDRLIQESSDSLKLSKEQKEFLESILNHYGLMSHERLIFLTHMEDPWNMARKGLGEFDYSNQKISLQSMKEYYSNFYNKKAATLNEA